ncbi:MAG TPA: hypothetical protein VG734_13645 [Lacunisphaera sp.]|nr:hypothetical protein [Lacunisphaera sp.]
MPPWRNEQVRRKAFIGIAAATAVVLVSLFIVYPRIDKWRKNRVLRLAEHYLGTEDYRSAYLLMEQFVQKDPGNLTARRLLARVYEVTSPEQALQEWEHLVQAEPGNQENYIGYGTTALKLGQTARLPAILAGLEKLAPDSVEFHRLAAAEAMATGDVALLRRHVDRLTALEPGNSLTRFTRAALQLGSNDPIEAAQGRTTMAEFARGNEMRVRATLALINDAPHRWPADNGAGHIYNLLADELKLRGSAAETRYVAARAYTRPPSGLTALIIHMEAQPGLAASDAVLLAQWMMQIGQTRDALFWLDTLDQALRTTAAVRQTMAACAMMLESWPRLEQLITDGAWGPVPVEAVKLAFAARSVAASQRDSKSGTQWNGAVRLCEQSLPGLQALQRLAQAWQWPDRQAQVLWILVRQFPADERAWRTLVQLATAAGDSAEFWRVHQAWAQAAASNPMAQGEKVLAGLLVRPGETGLGRMAADLFQEHPGIPACRVARALALWREGQAAPALAVLDAANLNYGREPRFALVRGLVCAKLGRAEDAERMFALLQGAHLLPEERALVAAARPSAH